MLYVFIWSFHVLPFSLTFLVHLHFFTNSQRRVQAAQIYDSNRVQHIVSLKILELDCYWTRSCSYLSMCSTAVVPTQPALSICMGQNEILQINFFPWKTFCYFHHSHSSSSSDLSSMWNNYRNFPNFSLQSVRYFVYVFAEFKMENVKV